MKNRYIFIIIYAAIIASLQNYIVSHSDINYDKLYVITISFLIIFLFFSVGKILSVILNLISLFLILFDVVISYKCGILTDGNIIAVVGSDRHQSLSMLQTVNPFILIATLVTLGLSGYLSWKLADFNKKSIVLSLLLMVWPSAMIIRNVKTYIQSANHVYSNRFLDIAANIKYRMPGMPGDLLFGTAVAFHPWDPIYDHPVARHTISNSSIFGKRGDQIHNIVFIMGESSLGKRYGIYGYQGADTTPVLNKLQKEGKICVIKNAHSASNITRLSVPMTFSFYSPKTQEALMSEKNIIELAQDHKYRTFWISTQGGTGPYARNAGYISEFSDYVTRGDLNNKENGIKIEKDDTLIPVIKEKFLEKYAYKLFVVHLFGSHLHYKDRVKPEDTQALPKADDYDQSIHHTDRIIGQIIQLADEELGDYTLIYTSDHGEVVSEGHGLQLGGYDQYDVPFIMHDPSNNYCTMAQLFEERRGYYTALMNKYILLSMIGYPFTENEIERLIPEELVLHSDFRTYKYTEIPKRHP